RIEPIEGANAFRLAALCLEHCSRPEAALSIRFAIVEAGLPDVRFRIDDRREDVRLGIEEVKTRCHTEDKAAFLAQSEATEIFRRAPRLVVACGLIETVDQALPDVDPP